MTKKEEEVLRSKIKELEEQLEFKNKLLVLFNEPYPMGETEQKKYVADIALFYQTVFKDKLKHFIGLQLEELAQIGRTELGNNILRSNISCFRLIDDWMESKTNEHIGNVENARQRLQNDEEFINNIKEKYGEN